MIIIYGVYYPWEDIKFTKSYEEALKVQEKNPGSEITSIEVDKVRPGETLKRAFERAMDERHQSRRRKTTK